MRVACFFWLIKLCFRFSEIFWKFASTCLAFVIGIEHRKKFGEHRYSSGGHDFLRICVWPLFCSDPRPGPCKIFVIDKTAESDATQNPWSGGRRGAGLLIICYFSYDFDQDSHPHSLREFDLYFLSSLAARVRYLLLIFWYAVFFWFDVLFFLGGVAVSGERCNVRIWRRGGGRGVVEQRVKMPNLSTRYSTICSALP